MTVPRLLLATSNRGKIDEYREILDGIEAALVTPADLGLQIHVDETGTTFRQNAALKARAYARASGLVTLAEDSGLEIDALGGEPGVYSARWGDTSDYAAKNRMVLARLEGVPWDKRTARYVSEAAVVDQRGKIWHYRGVVRGYIAFAPAGEGGFGYDPIFYVRRHRRTMAQLTAAQKHEISHRGRATRRALPRLQAVLGEVSSTDTA